MKTATSSEAALARTSQTLRYLKTALLPLMVLLPQRPLQRRITCLQGCLPLCLVQSAW